MCKAVLADPNVDMLAWANVLPTVQGGRDVAAVRTVAKVSNKPVLAFSRMSYMVNGPGLKFQDDVGLPFLQGLQPTLRSLSALAFYGTRVGRSIDPMPPPMGDPVAVSRKNLFTTLTRYVLRFPKSEVVQSPNEAVEAASRIGFPVALKIHSAEISHKTDVGGVLLNLYCVEKVSKGAERLQAVAQKAAPAAGVSDLLVQEMVCGVELFVGMRTDALYGPVMVVGAGGNLVELLQDVVFELLPIRLQDVGALLSRLRVNKLINGYRGPAGDGEALTQAIWGLSEFYLAYRNSISEIEVNPLILLEKDQGVRAVDVRVIPTDQSSDQSSGKSVLK